MTKIMQDIQPGIYPDMSNEAYHSCTGISKSGLSLILKSPLHYYNRYIVGEKIEPTPALILGTAFHTRVLEPEKFNYVVAPKCDRRTKAGKATYAEFLAQSEGKEILKPEEMEKVVGMANAVLAHPTASALLAPGEGVAEESIFWNDKETGELCKCRPDFRRFDGVLVDVKSAQDASPEGFSKAAFNFGYHIQDFFYRAGTSIATGENYYAFVFIVVESAPPYAVAIYMLDEDSKMVGESETKKALADYSECRKADMWRGYDPSITTLSLPGWAFK